MPEPKKPSPKRPFDAQVDSALDGMRLVSQPKPGCDPSPVQKQIPATPDEPDLVSKLITFIKTM